MISYIIAYYANEINNNSTIFEGNRADLQQTVNELATCMEYSTINGLSSESTEEMIIKSGLVHFYKILNRF